MYIPLNIKTDYSLLSSLIKIDDLIEKAKEYGFNALGVVDDNLCYSMEFYKKCIKNNIKPIIGYSFLLNNKKVYLYAKNYKGYQNLCFISSNEITIDLIKDNSNDLFLVLPYSSIELYDKLNIPDTYLGYTTEEEKDSKYKNIYFNEIKCLEKKDEEYLKYLSLIKLGKTISDEIEVEKDVSLIKDIEITKEENDIFNEIYNSVDIKIIKNNLLPVYNNDKSFDENKYLEELSKKGLSKRLNNKVPIKYAERLLSELSMIKKMGFSNYFLVVWDYVKYAKKNGILVGPGRGSAAGSLVSYSLGITEIDPIKYNLYFERFLNPERVTMPDIDIDFESGRREEVVKYVSNKYGNKNSAGIITYGTLKAKMVLRDVARVFNMENKVDSFIKMFDSNLSLEENLKNRNINEILKRDTLISRICLISQKLEGLKRLSSTHAAGIVISNEELDRYIPIIKNGDSYITGFTMGYLEELGLLKMDFLSLDNLILISDLINEIGNINLRDIPLNDEKTFDIFRNVNTEGIFQFESLGIKNILRKFKVNSFNDLTSILALFRPGPMDNIDTFIRRKDGKEKITYLHKDLEPILKDTYGIIVYQEQIIEIATTMASFTLGEADILRRAMSKKNNELMLKQKEKFINGCISNGYNLDTSEKVFDYINKFAAYGFNKSHSVSYALISYQMAYLKAHYKNYYMKYLLTGVIGNEYKTKEYINECKLNNIEILRPDINKSDFNYIIENNRIRFSLSSIKNVGSVISNTIIKEREKGLYKDFLDFVSRVYKKGVNKKAITYLIYASCFEDFYNKKTLIENLSLAINYAELCYDLDSSLIEKPEFDIKEEYTKEELIKIEYNTFGFYLSSHPVQTKRNNNMNTTMIKNYFNKIITIYLMIDRKKEIITKKQEKMLFITASDEYSEIELVVFPKVYEEFYNISTGDIFKVIGKVEKRGSTYQLIVNKLEKV